MQDIFVEQLVRRTPTAATRLLQALVLLALVLLILPLCFSPMALLAVPLGVIAGFFAARWLLRRLQLEFEYSLTNGELDVAMIVGRQKRQEMLSLRSSAIQYMAPVCPAHQSEFENPGIQTTFNAVSSDHSDQRWFLLFQQDGRLCRLIFEPKAELVDGLERFAPVVVHREK